MNISIKLINNGSEFIANCPELDINCYGADKNEAMQRIRKVIAFYIESARELGLDINPLKNISIDGSDNFYSVQLQSNTNDTIN
jgi:predicted RNase H-like HicB family nuclease